MLCYLPGFCIFIFIFFINFLGGWGLKEPHFIAKKNTDLESHRHLHNDDKKIFIRKKKSKKLHKLENQDCFYGKISLRKKTELCTKNI